MENKVVDNREEQRIEREAREVYPDPFHNDFETTTAYALAFREVVEKRLAYIAGATKEASRNKEDAIGFLNYLIDEQMVFDWSTQTFEQLYEIYKSGL